MEIKRWITENLKKKSNYIFYSGAILWLIVFIFIFFNFLNATGFNSWLAQKFSDYINQDIWGQVAGEYAVRIAANGTNFNPSFPKTMRQGAEFPQSKRTSSDFPDGAAPLIWSKYGAVAFSGAKLSDGYGQEFAREIKDYNPGTLVLGFPSSLLKMPASAPDDYLGNGSYFSYRADGTKNNAYGGLANFTKQSAGPYAITNGTDGFYDNLQSSDLQYFDGAFYPDGRSGFSPNDLCNDSRYKNLDFDENGIADVNEYGNSCVRGSEDVTEINTRWRAGYDARMQQERQTGSQISGKSWKVVINDGGPPIGDTVAPNTFKNLVDGFMFENAPSEWIKLKDLLIDWDINGKKPSLTNWVDTVGRRNKHWIKDGQNNFQKMRFNLTTTMLGDAYYGLCIGEGNMMCFWYDEFDLDLGQPKPNGRHEITSKCTKLCPWGDCPNWCPYVRFFDNGAILVNPTGSDLTLSESDISGFTGYDSPYYRFIGGQDPAVNNGQQFGSVILKSSVNDPSAESKKLASGDGIILIKQSNYSTVSEILVGNGRHDDTSPGSSPVATTGNWLKEWGSRDADGQGNPYYTQFLANWLPTVKICRDSWNDCSNDTQCNQTISEPCVLPQDATNGVAINDGYPMVYTQQAGATATFQPTIGIEGDYEIYEWHGWRGNFPDSYVEVEKVPVEIKSANGIENKIINQQVDYGKWNKIGGTYHFKAGTDGYVKFTHPGGSEYLIADVVKFVFFGNANVQPPEIKELSPDFNCDNKVDVQDFGILLSFWEKTEPPAILTQYANSKCAGKTKNLNLDCQKNQQGALTISGSDFGPLLGCWGTPNPLVSLACYNSCENIAYTPVCGNTIKDTSEACDGSANPSGAPANSTCKTDCSDFECNLGYTKSGNQCTLAQSSCTANLTNQYSKGVIKIIDPEKVPPAVGNSYCDVQFGTLIKRITGDSTTDGRGGSLNNGEVAHWNIDGSLFYARQLDGTHLFDANGSDLGKIHDVLPEWDIRWSADKDYVYKVVSDRNRIEYCNVRTKVCQAKKTFAKYDSVAWGQEGDLSDSRSIASLTGYYTNAGQIRAEIFVYDFQSDIIYAPAISWAQTYFDDGANGIDYHTISARGNYVVVSWHKGGQENKEYGIELYSRDMNFIKQLNAGKLHFDVGYDNTGNEVIFTRAGNHYATNHPLSSVNGIYDIIKIRLDNNSYNTAQVLMNAHSSSGDSLVFAAPNWQTRNYQYIYVSTFEDTVVNLANPTTWHEYWFEIIEVPTDGSKNTRRLLHNRSPVLTGMSHMAAQPDFSINGTGTKLFFKSDMNQSGTDLYLVDIAPR